jgi:hypothetical protein
MHPSKVDRNHLQQLTDLPNVGPATAKDLLLLGINEPKQLVGRDPYALYHSLCDITGIRHDPCVIDVFISITRFMSGDPPQDWWAYTEERKQILGKLNS